MTTPDELVAVELARLSASFVAQLREQVQAVEDEMTAWLEAPRDVERFEILSHKVHQDPESQGSPAQGFRQYLRLSRHQPGGPGAGATPWHASAQNRRGRAADARRRGDDAASN
jgi:hypothetical protein